MSMIKCRKHGRVIGPFCQTCKAERYLEKVREGKISPKVFAELFPTFSDITPLQIRYRAFIERSKRELAKIGKDVYPWQKKVRIPREFSSSLFTRKRDYE